MEKQEFLREIPGYEELYAASILVSKKPGVRQGSITVASTNVAKVNIASQQAATFGSTNNKKLLDVSFHQELKNFR